MSRFPFTRKLAALAASAFCLCMALAAPAGADDNAKYPSDPAARSFTGGTAGWTSSSDHDGACIPPVVCARVSNDYVAAADADGNGYISSDYLGVAGVGGVGGTTTGTWESPAFTYSGSGQGALQVSLSRRADVGEFLALAGSSAEYSVVLVDLTEGGQAQNLIAPRTLAGADGWTAVPPIAVKASRLNPGDSYRLRIVTAYETGTGVLVTGSADYDNVVLGPSSAGGNGGNGGGGNGSGGGKGKGVGDLSSSELRSAFGSAQSNTTAIVGGVKGGKAKRLMVRVSCPKKIGAACRVTAQGLLRKGRPATAKRTVKVRSGKVKRVILRVKPKLQSTVAKRKRLLVREKVRAGKTTATAYKVRKLIRH